MRNIVLAAVLALAFQATPAASQTAPSNAYGIVWIASSTGLKKVRTNDGALVLEIGDAKDCRAIATDGIAETVWCYGPENQLRSWTFDGTPVVNVSVPVLPNWGITYNGRPVTFEPFPSEAMGTLEDDPLFRDYVAIDVDPRSGDVYLAVADDVFGFTATGASNGFTYSMNGYTTGLAIDPTKPGLSLWLSHSRALNPLFYAGQTNRIFEIHDGMESDLLLPAGTVLQEFDLDASQFDAWAALPSLVRNGESWADPASATFAIRYDVPIAGADLRQIDGDSAGGAWLAEESSILRLSQDGSLAFEIVPFAAEIRIVDIAVEPRDQSLWVASKAIVKHFTSTGNEVHSLILDPLLRIRAISVYTDPEPPHIVFTSPSSGSVITSGFPTFTLEYDDVGLGIDPATLSVTSGTFPWMSCSASATAATCVPSDVAPDGFHLLVASIGDAGGNHGTAWLPFTVWKDTSPPPAPDGTLIDVSYGGGNATVTGLAGAVEPGATVRVRNTRTGDVVTVTAAGDGSFTATIAANPMDQLTIVAVDGASNDSEPTLLSVPPVDPATIATAIDRTVPFDIASGTEFLYSATNRVQVGVPPGTIDARRATVLRGEVRKSSGAALSGVVVSVPEHPEFGYTVSRSDGGWDLVVNGGGSLTVRFARDSYLTVDRYVEVPWREFVTLGDVHLTRLDANVVDVDFLPVTTSMQVAAGSVVSDADGTRQAVLMIPPGTTAELVFPNGTTAPLAGGRLRATEYTVGPNGPKAMFATLPPTTGYTYAVEISADEEIRSGAAQLRFDTTVLHYVENFLEMPVGSVVPNGYYDRVAQRWVGEDNGLVIEVFGVSGGLAEVVVDESGLPASETTLAALGFTNEELETLATRYSPGTELWRVPVTHFSPRDFNYAVIPGGQPTQTCPKPTDCEKYAGGSIIGCTKQTLGESLPLTGTGVRLTYQSDRTRGFVPHIEIPLTGATVPSGLSKIHLEVSIAGKKTTATFPPSANLIHVFEWDGKDAYGRELQGGQPVHIRIGYAFPSSYLQPASGAVYLSQNGGEVSFPLAPTGLAVFSSFRGSLNGEIIAWQDLYEVIGSFDASAIGLAGWGLDLHHVYDPSSQILYLGNGAQRTEIAGTVRRVAGHYGFGTASGDGGLARFAPLSEPNGVAVAPDGSFFLVERAKHRVRRVSRDGVITTFAGTGSAGFSGDGGPATQAKLFWPEDVAIGLDGAVYIADTENDRVRRVAPDGTISTIAGTGVAGFSGDGGPAVLAQLSHPHALDIGPDGALYIVDYNVARIRRVDGAGRIVTVAGGGAGPSIGDGGPATDAVFWGPYDVEVASDGSIYVADGWQERVRKVATDGIIDTFAGGAPSGANGDGGPATSAYLMEPRSLTISRAGTVYIGVSGAIRAVGPDGNISTFVGEQGTFGCTSDESAASSRIKFPAGLDMMPDGSVLFGDEFCSSVSRVETPLPPIGPGTKVVPSADGGTLYVFDSRGRHVETRDALLNIVRMRFAYDAEGVLSSVTDHSGNQVSIARNAGVPTAIIAPGGQRTTLGVDANGMLASVANPAGETFSLVHTSKGLLTSFENPRGNQYAFTYDARGRLLLDEDPAGGSQSLARSVSGATLTVTRETELGRTSTYRVERTEAAVTSTDTMPDGTAVISHRTNDGVVHTTYPDGSTMTASFAGDPRFGSASPLAGRTEFRTPGGKVTVVEEARTAVLRNPSDIYSLDSATWTKTVNGKQWRVEWLPSIRRRYFYTPFGRFAFADVDTKGRPTHIEVGNRLAPATVRYDARGRVDRVTTGTGADERVYAYEYDSANRLIQVTDPLGRRTRIGYDAADRMDRVTSLGDGRETTATYNANGGIASLTPPERPAHTFDYTPVDLESTYRPPLVAGGGATVTQYEYSLDRELKKVTRPDLATIAMAYDTAGRVTAVSHTHGAITIAYHPTTGQLSSLTESNGQTLTFGWDAVLPTSETWSGVVSGGVSRVFDDDLLLTTEKVNGAHPVTYSYDADGNVIGAGGLTIVRGWSDSLIDSTTLGSVTTSRQYNVFAEPIVDTASTSAGQIYRVDYERDKLGRITTRVEAILGTTMTWTYAYDTSGRLTAVTKNGAPSSEYAYDGNGNRLSHTTPTTTVTGTYDDQDRILSYGGTTFSWTANGELQSKTDASGTTAYTYDALGNLRSVALPNGDLVEYVIDGRNRRVGRKVNGTLAQQLLYRGQLQPVAELDAAGNVVSRFVYATRVNVPDYIVKPTTGAVWRVVTDHLGSVRLVVDDASGAVVQRIDYDEFGRVLADTNPGAQPFGFAGGLWDGHVGLVRFGARDYDPVTGRWTTKDPIGFAAGDTNLYQYAFADPINFIDPHGLDVYVWNDPTGSHVGLTIDNPTSSPTGYTSVELPGPGWNNPLQSLQGGPSSPLVTTNPPPQGAIRIPTHSWEDAKAVNLAKFYETQTLNYTALGYNCADFARDILQDAGLPIREVFTVDRPRQLVKDAESYCKKNNLACPQVP